MVVKQALLRVKGYNKYKTGGKKRNGNCLAGNYHSSENIMHMRIDNNKPNREQRQSEFKPLKTGWPKLDLQKGWQEFISRYDFDLFVTLTFREDIKHGKAVTRFKKWLGSLNHALFGWRYKRKGLGIRYAVAYESQKRGTLHLHVLLGAEGLKELNMEYMAKLWKCNGQRDKNGTLIDRIVNGHAVIDIYDPARGAIQYMTKHIYKDGELDMSAPRKEREEGKCL
jgi:hypothetical protein